LIFTITSQSTFRAEAGIERATIPFVADPWEDGDQHIDVEEIRAHIRRLSDPDLLRYGRAARYMTSPYATWGKESRLVFRVQLDESRAEWRRRFGEIN
jgi:hypothetical protein